MATATKPKEAQTLTTLANNVRNHINSSDKEFNTACKELVDYITDKKIVMIFNKTPFIEAFCRKELMDVAKDADAAGKNFWPYLAKISKVYNILA
ncbi:hypothetical protein C4580_01270 [Candidatus Woesearchaeota archaeon]|nr:MAG: hypothetical protein C4580_01270 [Candidatus Woesearchaeota archaeon]